MGCEKDIIVFPPPYKKNGARMFLKEKIATEMRLSWTLALELAGSPKH